jgi:hypothetical protein
MTDNFEVPEAARRPEPQKMPPLSPYRHEQRDPNAPIILPQSPAIRELVERRQQSTIGAVVTHRLVDPFTEPHA